jgi:hypothetical protein
MDLIACGFLAAVLIACAWAARSDAQEQRRVNVAEVGSGFGTGLPEPRKDFPVAERMKETGASIQGRTISLVLPKSGACVAAYSGERDTWGRVAFDHPLDAEVYAKACNAAAVRDSFAVIPTPDSVYAFSAKTGTWDRMKFDRPLDAAGYASLCKGIAFFESLAVVQTDDSIYAYSAETGNWGRLKLGEGTGAYLQVTGVLGVQDGNRFYVFGRDAQWSGVDLDNGDVLPPPAK